MKKNYGLPYQGSKNRIAEDIVDFLPKKKVLIDLFGGGGAISVCALQKQKYDKIIYNELNYIIAETFQKAINGEYENDHRWISREDFFRLKDTDGYVAVCFSFSNNLQNYIYGPKIEPYKRAYHYAVVFNNFEPFSQLFDDETTEKMKKSVEGVTDLKERRMKFTKALGEYILSLEDDKFSELKPTVCTFKTYITHTNQNLECDERLNLLKHTMNMNGSPRNAIPPLDFDERLNLSQNQIEVLNLDYANVPLPNPEDCVIYCDIPYENTWKYNNNSFDYQRFYDWCKQKHSEGYEIYVSSYELPEDLFTEVWAKQRNCKASSSKGKKVTEKLFVLK